MTKLKQGTLTVFLCSMQPNHMFSNRRAVRVGDSEEEDEEEAKLHEAAKGIPLPATRKSLQSHRF